MPKESSNAAIVREHRLRIALGLLAVFIARTMVAQSVERPSFSVTVKAPQKTLPIGSEIKVEVVLKNSSNRDIVVGKTPGNQFGESFYAIEVRNDHHQLAEESNYMRSLRGEPVPKNSPVVLPLGSVISVTLKPREILVDYIMLSKLYVLDKPGKYTIRCSRLDYQTKEIVKSKTVAFTVGP